MPWSLSGASAASIHLVKTVLGVINPVRAVKASLSRGTLDFNPDHISLADWKPVLSALAINKHLQHVSIKSCHLTSTGAQSSYKAHNKKKTPVIHSRNMTLQLCKAVQKCLCESSSLKTLHLHGLPLRERDLTALTKGNDRTRNSEEPREEPIATGIGGQPLRYHMMAVLGSICNDLICQSVKYSSSIKTVDFTSCNITWQGAEHMANIIKHQAVRRHSAVWVETLRYRRAEFEAMKGLRRVTLNDNILIGDRGVMALTRELTEDLWVKGAQKDANNIKSCLKVLNECGDNIPKFVSYYLDELPPVTFSSVDVCGLLRKVEQLHADVSVLKHAMHRQSETGEGLSAVAADVSRRVCALEQNAAHGGAGFDAPVSWMENASTTRTTHYTDVGDADGSAEVPETTGDTRRGEAPRPVLQAMESIMPAASPGLTRLSPGLPKWNQVVKRGRQKRTEESQQGVRIGKSVLERRAAKIVVGTGAARDIKMITTKRSVFMVSLAKYSWNRSIGECTECIFTWAPGVLRGMNLLVCGAVSGSLSIFQGSELCIMWCTSSAHPQVELEECRLRLAEERNTRLKTNSRLVELELENERLRSLNQSLSEAHLNASVLDDEHVLESIESSFHKFHAFLDLLKDAGLGRFASMAGIDQSDFGLLGHPQLSSTERTHISRENQRNEERRETPAVSRHKTNMTHSKII
ncbi:uncharacterized protein LOC130081791 [Rhinichthys klamathensis goyatoka]|uniref:uncharacterized protein LOC130081791 n=1 Tax=Rhinichthys klamathensis goyatoka TaxID=3034132 RepID=UPI0024B49311|nr:uncharacterized protein LOC130081791 [Rhinichthys klamathensis goyatoka]